MAWWWVLTLRYTRSASSASELQTAPCTDFACGVSSCRGSGGAACKCLRRSLPRGRIRSPQSSHHFPPSVATIRTQQGRACALQNGLGGILDHVSGHPGNRLVAVAAVIVCSQPLLASQLTSEESATTGRSSLTRTSIPALPPSRLGLAVGLGTESASSSWRMQALLSRLVRFSGVALPIQHLTTTINPDTRTAYGTAA